jgi:DNA-binding CsgD family transcriptional regulator
LGLAAWQAGDGALALARLHESLAVRHQMNARLGIVECLEALAEVTVGSAATAEEVRRALHWLGAADALREQMGAPRPPVEQPAYDAAIEAAGRWLEDLAAGALEGWPRPFDTIVADVLADTPSDARAGHLAPAPSPVKAVTPATRRASSGSAEPGPVPSDGPVPAGLSPREVEVLRLIAAGRTNAEIAEILVVSTNTVRHHVTHILDKTGCENRAAATAFAHRRHLV